MVWNKQKLKTAVVACLVALTLATNDFSFARVIGPVAPILKQIASFLHAKDIKDIDVVCCNAQAPGKRPRVELMADMSFDIRVEQSPTDFSLAKALSQIGRLFAVPASFADTKAAERQFRSAWKRAPESQRVFLSFTRDDLPYANKIKEALESNDYTTFMYLNEEGGPPKYFPKFTDQMFRSAGHYLVLDTPAARKSMGMLAEKIAFEKLRPELFEKQRPRTRRDERDQVRDEREVLRALKDAEYLKGKTERDPWKRYPWMEELSRGRAIRGR